MVDTRSMVMWLFVAGVCGFVLFGCGRDETVAEEKAPATKMTIRSSAFESGKPIPRKHTGEGKNTSPPLAWSNLPEGTKTLALICDDPDAPRRDPWVHWVIYNIPATETGLAEGIPPSATLTRPAGALQGMNSRPTVGYRGPMPPPGHGVHHYHFKLYAIDATLNVKSGLTKTGLLDAMKDHIVGRTELVGTYER